MALRCNKQDYINDAISALYSYDVKSADISRIRFHDAISGEDYLVLVEYFKQCDAFKHEKDFNFSLTKEGAIAATKFDSNWEAYKESLVKPKKDYWKIIIGVIAVLSFIYNVFSTERIYSKNKEIDELNNTIDQLSKEHKELDSNIDSTISSESDSAKVVAADSL